jgi:hypothetical protein
VAEILVEAAATLAYPFRVAEGDNDGIPVAGDIAAVVGRCAAGVEG